MTTTAKATKIKCKRYKTCKTYIPVERIYNARSRGKEPLYCSDTCQHTAGVARWRANRPKKKAS